MTRRPWGADRIPRLGATERRLYGAILRSFAEGRPPAAAGLSVGGALIPDVDRALARLGEEDLVHVEGPEGTVVVAYPFSGRPTDHRVRLDGRELHAMCAVDALGIPFMVGEPAEIVSRDPLTGEEVWARIEPGDGVWWEPQPAVVLSAGSAEAGSTASARCRFVNFFASAESAAGFLDEQPGLEGTVLSLPEAVEAGCAVFGGLLEVV